MKRIVTGRGEDGRDTVLIDDAVTGIAGMKGSTNETRLCWATPTHLHLPGDGTDPVENGVMSMPAPGEARFLFVTFAPGTSTPVHATPTIDFIAAVAGELWLVMEDGSESRLIAGDAVIQNGTRHAWENRSGLPCTIAATMIGAHMSPEGPTEFY